MSRVRSSVCAAALAVLAAVASADDEPLGQGSFLASGSKITTSIDQPVDGQTPVGDTDQFVFDGYVGQTVSISATGARVAKGAKPLFPALELYRPDGTRVAVSDGAKVVPKATQVPGTKSSITFKLDQTGVWTIRVSGNFPARLMRGDNPATEGVVEKTWIQYDFGPIDPETDKPDGSTRTKGDYTLTIKYGAPKPTVLTNVAADELGIFTFLVPANGSCEISGVLSYKGGAPIIDAVRLPSGTKLATPVPTSDPRRRTVSFKSNTPAGGPIGTYQVQFRTNAVEATTGVRFTGKVKILKPEKALKTKMAKVEPYISDIDTPEGGPDVTVGLTCWHLDTHGTPRVFLDRIEMDVDEDSIQREGTITRLKFQTPGVGDLPDGTYNVRVMDATGQSAVLRNGFTVVPAPRVDSVDPTVGTAAGGFTVTIRGSNFSAQQNGMLVKYRNKATNVITSPPLTFSSYSSTHLTYTQPVNFPGLGAGEYFIIVENRNTQRTATAPMTLTLSQTAVISRVLPGLVPILGGDTIYVQGTNFRSTDIVWAETSPGSGNYENMTQIEADAGRTAFQNSREHRFRAPARAKGAYRVFVEDEDGYQTPIRTYSYFQLSDMTSTLGFTGADKYDGWTTALGDLDRDPASPGAPELVVSRRGGANTKSSTSETRVLKNDGTGAFTDVTATAMPAVTSDDDWRADKVCLADINLDGYLDIVLTTNSDKFPVADSKSHTRILINERRTMSGAESDRAFRDRTQELMAPMRKMSVLYSAGGKNEVDDWRGLDMFVGDIDVSNLSPPEIVIVTDRVFENYYVSCTPYCASLTSGGYTYSFYWGGTRVMKWDQSARDGLGRYDYDQNYFPRVSGITVGVFNPPPGVTIPTCSPNKCRGNFPPFVGQRLAVGAIDGDGKPDFAVLNNAEVKAYGAVTSSLQVALNKVGSDGSNVTNVTPELTSLGAADMFKGDTVAIGHPSHNGQDLGVVAVAKADATGLNTSALRLLQWKLPAAAGEEGDVGDFVEITSTLLPSSTPNDRFASTQLAFLDVDFDGDEDLVSLARSAPGGNNPAFRIFRNMTDPVLGSVYQESLRGLVTPLPLLANGYFDGDVLAVGDLDRDGAQDYVITRSTLTPAAGPHTRAIKTDK